MNNSHEFLQDISIVMVVAGLTTLLFNRLKIPSVLGYILAGLVIGPHLAQLLPESLSAALPLPLISSQNTVRLLSELGVILLMFRMGLHFSIRKLIAIGPVALIAGAIEIFGMLWVGYQLGLLFGWSTIDSVFLGAIVSISSTTIIFKTISDLKLGGERFADVALGILIVEDILAVAIIAVLSSFAATGGVSVGEVGYVILKLGAFFVTVLVVGLLIVPRILRFVWRYHDPEMLLVTALGLCFGVALVASNLGYSVALGAFLIGAVIAECREAGAIDSVIEPVRAMFSAVFFVSVGMLIEPRLLVEYALPILILSTAVIVGKTVWVTAGVFVASGNAPVALRTGLAMTQIGEFSFIIAQLGQQLQVTSAFLYPVAVAISVVTTATTPLFISSSLSLSKRAQKSAPQALRAAGSMYQRFQRDVRARILAGSLKDRFPISTVSGLIVELLLMAAILLYTASRWPTLAGYLPFEFEWLGGKRGAVWLTAMLVMLPIVAAAFANARYLGSCIIFGSHDPAFGTPRDRFLGFALGYLLSGGVALAIFLLSSALLPSGPSLLVLFGVLVLLIISQRSRLHEVYRVGRGDVITTVVTDWDAQHEAERKSRAMPEGLVLRSISLQDSPAAGKLIRELHLRSETGASIVAIDRASGRLLSPGPDEELQAGDLVTVVGTAEQLKMAHEYFRR